MIAPADPIQRRKTQVIAALFGINLLFGVLAVMLYVAPAMLGAASPVIVDMRDSPLSLGYQIATLVLCFLWLGIDSHQLDIRRPWWLNIGIVLAALIFIPYYLYKTRPAGRRRHAILGFLGILLGCIVSLCIGMSVAMTLRA